MLCHAKEREEDQATKPTTDSRQGERHVKESGERTCSHNAAAVAFGINTVLYLQGGGGESLSVT